MKRILIALTILAGLALNGTLVWANTLEQIKKDGLRVCLEPGYMPFGMLNKEGKIIGYDIDLAELMIKELGAPKLELVSIPWNDIIPALIANKCEIIMSGMSITEERRQKVDFSSAYIVIGQTVLLRKALAGKINSYSDLDDPAYKVIAKQGTTSETAAKTNISKAQITLTPHEQEGVAAVLSGKADAFIYDSPYNAIAAGQYGEDKLVFLESPFTFEPLGWAVRKGDPEFLAWLNSFIEKIDKSGVKYALYRKWFKNTNWLNDVKQP